MIAIRKPLTVPRILATEGVEERNRICAQYDNGGRKIKFKRRIYAHSEVYEALRDAQHNKCCFCEQRLRAGDIEHFRPKAAVSQGVGHPVINPGYYWLAYEWTNLFLCCSHCNSRCKGNFFPLLRLEDRARDHHDDIAGERPLLINPAILNPEEHIEFHRDIPITLNESQAGTKTIEVMHLDDEDLNELRRQRLELLATHALILRVFGQSATTEEELAVIEQAERILEKATGADAEFASMARCAASSNWYLDEDE